MNPSFLAVGAVPVVVVASLPFLKSLNAFSRP
jgi:hypothetical protein